MPDTRGDCLQRFIFDDAPLRGALVHLDESYQQVLACREYPKVIRRALGELMVAAQLLAANLKFDGRIVLQIQSEGHLKILLAEASSERCLRASASLNYPLSTECSLLDLLAENASFIISLHPTNGEIYSGIVEIKGSSLAQMLMNYLQTSEQIDSYLYLESNEQSAAGILLQRLPDAQFDAEKYQHILLLTQTLQVNELLELEQQKMLYRLFHSEQIRLFAPEYLSFFCTCSEEKVAQMLLGLGFQEAESVLQEQGSIEIICDFCARRYVFDEQETAAIFHEPSQEDISNFAIH